jgi:single-stranded-DNA-specific exonuclease
VAGLVASRLAESFWRPAFVFCEEDGLARGSARSIPGFHVYEAIARCRGLLQRFGGHEGAAGLTLELQHLEDFARRMDEHARRVLGPSPPTPRLELEGEVALEQLSLALIEELERLEPFGEGNPQPLMATHGLLLVGQPQLVGSRRSHLAFLVQQEGLTRRAIAFNRAEWLAELRARRGEPFSLAFQPEINDFTGTREVELRAEDIRWPDGE